MLLAATLGLWLGKDHWSWAVKYPRSWVVPLKRWIGDFMKWLINDFDLGLFTFKEFTRGIAWVLEWPHWLAKGLLAQGFKFPTGEDAFWLTPTLSWLGLVVVLTLLAWRIKDRTLALLIGLCFLYLAVFGQWDSAMITLSSIMVAVPLGVAGGLALGIQGYRSPRIERAITPVLDLMQTVPVFAYLVPILFLFGFGPVAAMIATMIYAMPPMVRVTMLALKTVPEEIKEFGRMAGCSRRQMMWKVLVPAARPTLMVGVNQVIMLSLNMVIIASMIGAGGLGHDVLASLRRLAIGQGLEAGIAITLLAVALDRLSQAFSQTAPAGGHEADHEGRAQRPGRAPSLLDRCAGGAVRHDPARPGGAAAQRLPRGRPGHHRAVLGRPGALDQHQLLRPARGGEDLPAAQSHDPVQTLPAAAAVAGGGRHGRARRAGSSAAGAWRCSRPCWWPSSRSRAIGKRR